MYKLLQPPILIVGIGDDNSHDNAAGLAVARTIAKTLNPSPDISIMESTGDGSVLIEAWKNAKTAILVDAVWLGDLPGTLYYFDAHDHNLPTEHFYHAPCAFNFTEAIGLAKMLRELPPITLVYGIEREQYTPGNGLSPYVEQTVEVLAALLRDWAQSYAPYAVA